MIYVLEVVCTKDLTFCLFKIKSSYKLFLDFLAFFLSYLKMLIYIYRPRRVGNTDRRYVCMLVCVCVIHLLHFFCIDYRLRCCCCCRSCCCCCCCCCLLSGRSLGLRRKRCSKLLQLSESSCVTLAAVALRM